MRLAVDTMKHGGEIIKQNKDTKETSVSYYNIPTSLLQDFFIHLVDKDVRLTLTSKLFNYLQVLL